MNRYVEFKKERDVVLEAAKQGIVGNLKLSKYQKKYVKAKELSCFYYSCSFWNIFK